MTSKLEKASIDWEERIEGVLIAYRGTIFSPIPCLTVVSFPYQEDCSESEQEISAMERYNSELEKFRVSMFCGGWWWSIGIPYEYHPDGGLVVKWFLPLDEETTFERPWDFPKNGYDQSPTHREAFLPAVPLSAKPYRTTELTKSADSSLCPDFWLVWHWNLTVC